MTVINVYVMINVFNVARTLSHHLARHLNHLARPVPVDRNRRIRNQLALLAVTSQWSNPQKNGDFLF